MSPSCRINENKVKLSDVRPCQLWQITRVFKHQKWLLMRQLKPAVWWQSLPYRQSTSLRRKLTNDSIRPKQYFKWLLQYKRFDRTWSDSVCRHHHRRLNQQTKGGSEVDKENTCPTVGSIRTALKLPDESPMKPTWARPPAKRKISSSSIQSRSWPNQRSQHSNQFHCRAQVSPGRTTLQKTKISKRPAAQKPQIWSHVSPTKNYDQYSKPTSHRWI